ncbi:MAG TPA: GH92 family glycosyl hydrolase [Draconibacterium sp.]|nr:GH92 family glycosyl hydrolase [Draconibacterium sp.]
MKSFILTLSFLFFTFSIKANDNLNYVNPFIGTAPSNNPSNWEGHGRTYPGAVAPFGYIQLTPETRLSPSKGYDYRDDDIYFFSCFHHLSGYPNGSSGQCKIMPVENWNSFQINNHKRPFSHNSETAEPGYYKVKFNDNGTTIEATSSIRSGMFRFDFNKNANPKIFIGDIGEIILENPSVKGSKRNTWIEFETPWQSAEKSGDGYIFTFDKPDQNTLLLKLSSSSVSFQNAKKNLDAEIPDWDFDALKNKTQNDWKKELSVIEIQDSSIQNKTKFYTALYHSLLIPWIISDTDGTYLGLDGKIQESKGENQYGTFSPWDTFRSLHPLLCIIAPKRQNDMIISMLDIYEQSGQLPVEPMTGFHSIPIIVDSYLKGITGFDKALAYKAMKNLLLSEDIKKADLKSYFLQGFVSSDYPESVTRTVEYAYDDWVLSQFAKEVMNQDDDYSHLLKRSLNYRNLFDPSQLFLVPRNEKDFVHSIDNFGYKEGDKWNYSLFVPQNIRDIINLKGGNHEFSNQLESTLNNRLILFDNEPNFHIPYLFNYAKQPFKTQEWVSKIRETQFTATADGLPGNDDLGSMSSWFVFNALGFFPVCPGVPQYNIGTPLFEKVIIHNQNGNDFTITGLDKSPGNNYILSAKLNGEDFNQVWFNHYEILNGGEITFSLGPNPADWAVNTSSEPYSVTKKEAVILVDSIWVPKSGVDPNELFKVNFILKNTGSSGVKIARLLTDGKEVARKNIYVEEGKTISDSVFCRLYKPGISKLSLEGSNKTVNVKVNKSNVRKFEISHLTYIPLLKVGETQQISFSAKNIGGSFDTIQIPVYLNNKLLKTATVEAAPGETVIQKFNFSDYNSGVNTLQTDSLKGIFKVYADNKNTTLVDLQFQQKNSGVIKDQSGLMNHGIIQTTNTGNPVFSGFDENNFVEIKNNPSFSVLNNNITMMAWVKLPEPEKYPVSIITQGDHNVIQLNRNEIEFFAGGWGRGACIVNISNNLFDGWHHLAGVAEGLSLKFYVDGELLQTVPLDNLASLVSRANWNLGRNEEFPGKRIFTGEMNGVKIFAAALSVLEIKAIINETKK